MTERRTIARPYAEAAFVSARTHDQLPQWSQMLRWLGFLARDPRMQALLSDPRSTRVRVAKLVTDVSHDRLAHGGENFIRLLIENRRAALLPEIAELYEERKARFEDRIDAVIQTAYPLDDASRIRLTQSLERRLGRRVQLTEAVDSKLYGGIVIRAGDLVIDGSVRGRLAFLGATLNQ